MKKVIILCSALVFNFLTCPEASAYNARFEAADIEIKLTELIGLVDSPNAKNEIVRRYTQKIKKLVNNRPQIWMGTGDLKIVGDRVEFIGPYNQPHQGKNRIGKAEAQKVISEIQEEINQLKAKRSSVAKGTLPEPANLIPWPSQNSSSGQDYAENNRIEGKTGTLALPAPDNRTEEGNSRLALPAPQGNSENQRHQVEEGNIENSEPSSNDSTPSISRQSSISFDSNKYPTEEEEPNADATGTKNGEQETRKDSAPSENNGTNTNSSDQNFPRHYREEFGDFPSYDLSSPSSRRSSVSSANSKFSNADHQSDSGNESSSNDANGFGSTFPNHYNDSLFDN